MRITALCCGCYTLIVFYVWDVCWPSIELSLFTVYINVHESAATQPCKTDPSHDDLLCKVVEKAQIELDHSAFPRNLPLAQSHAVLPSGWKELTFQPSVGKLQSMGD